MRVLPGIDWDLLRRRPRAYVGYSDLTPFLLEVVRRLGPRRLPWADGRGRPGPRARRGRGGVAARRARRPLSGGSRSARAGCAPAPSATGEAEVRGTAPRRLPQPARGTLGTPFAPDLAGADRLLGGRRRAAVPRRPHVDPPGALGYSGRHRGHDRRPASEGGDGPRTADAGGLGGAARGRLAGFSVAARLGARERASSPPTARSPGWRLPARLRRRRPAPARLDEIK